jgi:hypothetical protein
VVVEKGLLYNLRRFSREKGEILGMQNAPEMYFSIWGAFL